MDYELDDRIRRAAMAAMVGAEVEGEDPLVLIAGKMLNDWLSEEPEDGGDDA